MNALKSSLYVLPAIKKSLAKATAKLLANIHQKISTYNDLVVLIDKAIVKILVSLSVKVASSKMATIKN